jgi:hypothetical protein
MRLASTLVSFVCNCLPLQGKAKPTSKLQGSELQIVLEHNMILKWDHEQLTRHCTG